jgi:hypothetical protein
MTKKLILNLDDETFQWLEVLAFGLNIEEYPDDRKNEKLMKGHNKKNDDFAPLVSRLMEDVACSFATGVRRSGSWERGTVDALTGWDGTYAKGMFGDLVDYPNDTPMPS